MKDGIRSRPFFLNEMRGDAVNKPRHLTVREWKCVLVASYFSVGKHEEGFVELKDGLTTYGISERAFSELFLHLSLLLGFPTMLEGLAMLRSVAEQPESRTDRGMKNNQVFGRGMRTLKRVYGGTMNRLLANLKFLHNAVPGIIVRDVYGRIISRPGLTLCERELVNVAVLNIQKLEQQLYSHVRGALRLRVPQKTLGAAILLSSQVAEIDSVPALRLLSSFAKSS